MLSVQGLDQVQRAVIVGHVKEFICLVVQQVKVNDGQLVEGNLLFDVDLKELFAQLCVLLDLKRDPVVSVGANEARGVEETQVKGLDRRVDGQVVGAGGVQRWVIAIKTKNRLPNTLPIILNCVIGIIN